MGVLPQRLLADIYPHMLAVPASVPTGVPPADALPFSLPDCCHFGPLQPPSHPQKPRIALSALPLTQSIKERVQLYQNY
jgi:hypothetical protein